MARLEIRFRTLTEEGYKTLDKTVIIGAKQTKTWIRKNYGKYAEDMLDDEMYYIAKPNRFGIVWLTKDGRNHTWSFSTSDTHAPNRKAERTPSVDISVYKY